MEQQEAQVLGIIERAGGEVWGSLTAGGGCVFVEPLDQPGEVCLRAAADGSLTYMAPLPSGSSVVVTVTADGEVLFSVCDQDNKTQFLTRYSDG